MVVVVVVVLMAVMVAGFVQTLESPGILLFRIPVLGKSWKKA